jgi:hypothetical protein
MPPTLGGHFQLLKVRAILREGFKTKDLGPDWEFASRGNFGSRNSEKLLGPGSYLNKLSHHSGASPTLERVYARTT